MSAPAQIGISDRVAGTWIGRDRPYGPWGESHGRSAGAGHTVPAFVLGQRVGVGIRDCWPDLRPVVLVQGFMVLTRWSETPK